jgi:hypothetical protein
MKKQTSMSMGKKYCIQKKKNMSADETNCIDEETDGPDGKENANAGKRKSVRLDDAPSVGRDAKSNHLRSFVLDKKKNCSSTHSYPLAYCL